MLNLGQGVAWDGWYGRGVRTNHPEDYAAVRPRRRHRLLRHLPGRPRQARSGRQAVVRGPGRRAAAGLGRAASRSSGTASSARGSATRRPSPRPQQVKAEVWMSLIHGSRGLIYFCHQFKPKFIEAGLLADAEMARAVGAINRQVHSLAPVLATALRCRPPRGSTVEPGRRFRRTWRNSTSRPASPWR